MRRADIITRLGIAESRFDSLHSRGLMPFDVPAGRWAEYTEEQAVKLNLMLTLAAHGMTLPAASALVRKSMEGALRVLHALSGSEVRPGGQPEPTEVRQVLDPFEVVVPGPANLLLTETVRRIARDVVREHVKDPRNRDRRLR